MDSSYKFEMYATQQESVRFIVSAAQKCNRKKMRTHGDEISFKMAPSLFSFKLRFSIFLFEKNGITTIGITVKGYDDIRFHTKAYNKFLNALISSGANISVAPGEPRIISANMIGNGTETQFVNRFGGVVTDMRTARMKTTLSKNVPFRIFYSNGMIEEKEVKRGSKLYSEIMTKLVD